MPPFRPLLLLLSSLRLSAAFISPALKSAAAAASSSSFALSSTTSMAPSLIEPSKRNSEYGQNHAQYLVDLHDSKATFDFCGGMMFQLVLTDMLRDHLVKVAEEDTTTSQPMIYDASHPRMFNIPNYAQNADADNQILFHGRELRSIPHAEGGFGFVLQLSMANSNDPEGWSSEEINEYDGWGHDAGRKWRKANDYENEGFVKFKEMFGPKAFGLHHRFYLHYDGMDRMWLSAEDGCEGTPGNPVQKNPISRMFGL